MNGQIIGRIIQKDIFNINIVTILVEVEVILNRGQASVEGNMVADEGAVVGIVRFRPGFALVCL